MYSPSNNSISSWGNRSMTSRRERKSLSGVYSNGKKSSMSSGILNACSPRETNLCAHVKIVHFLPEHDMNVFLRKLIVLLM